MRNSERAALAAIVASGLLARSHYQTVAGLAQQALAIADAILDQTNADDKAAYDKEHRTHE